MNFFTKIRVSGWIIALLVILNLFTLGMLWFHQIRQPSLPPPPQERGPEHVQQFLEQELGLTKEQTQQFETLRQEHFVQTKTLTDRTRQLKTAMMSEVFAPAPDIEKMTKLAEDIGMKQAELEQLTFNHFLELKSICQPEQIQKLQSLMHRILPPPESGGPPGVRNAPNNERPVPPPESVDACRGKIQGDTCQFTSPHGTVSGTCMSIGSQLACAPKDAPPGPPPRGSR